MQTIASKMDLADDVTDPIRENKREEEKALGKLETISEGSKFKSLIDRLL